MKTVIISIFAILMVGCLMDQEDKDRETVQSQQRQYSIAQPVPKFDFSLERDLLIQLYNIRNQRVSTHSVWRSDRGVIEGDCASMGFGIPYDTSLTNPLQIKRKGTAGVSSIGQAEPNGIFASTNTAATWVMCVGQSGAIEPMYIETKVTVYPGPVVVDYDSNRVKRVGEPTVTISGE
jgi:hypothetical protein